MRPNSFCTIIVSYKLWEVHACSGVFSYGSIEQFTIHLILFVYFAVKTLEEDVTMTDIQSTHRESSPSSGSNSSKVWRADQQSSPGQDNSSDVMPNGQPSRPLQDNAILSYVMPSPLKSDTVKHLAQLSPLRDRKSALKVSKSDRVASLCNTNPNGEKHKSLTKVWDTKSGQEDGLHEHCSSGIVRNAYDTFLHEKHLHSKKENATKMKKKFCDENFPDRECKSKQKHRWDQAMKFCSPSLQSQKFGNSIHHNKKWNIRDGCPQCGVHQVSLDGGVTPNRSSGSGVVEIKGNIYFF